jgi:hypothetical protein
VGNGVSSTTIPSVGKGVSITTIPSVGMGVRTFPGVGASVFSVPSASSPLPLRSESSSSASSSSFTMPSIEYDDGGNASSLCADGLVIVDGIVGFVFRSNDMTTGGMVTSSTTGGSVDGGGDVDMTLGIVGVIVLMVPLGVPNAGANVPSAIIDERRGWVRRKRGQRIGRRRRREGIRESRTATAAVPPRPNDYGQRCDRFAD